MKEDSYPTHSPLSQSITRDGKTVQVRIYEDGEGGWLLEVLDEHLNSTVWDDPFLSDKDALDEALKAIDEEGIDSLIGFPPDSPAFQQASEILQMMERLSEEEMDELDDFFMSGATSDSTMMLDCLDGYLTALATGPITLKPTEWLPRVWGLTGKDEPTFDSLEQAQRITSLITRQLNGIISSFQENPGALEPVFGTYTHPDSAREYVDGEIWAYGYMTGINLLRPSWKAFFDCPDSAKVLRPIYLLGADDVTDEEEELTKTPEQREELTNQIPASVAWIYQFWQPYRQAIAERTVAAAIQQVHPEIAHNDPCPCGSGMKFEKCCGAPTVLH